MNKRGEDSAAAVKTRPKIPKQTFGDCCFTSFHISPCPEPWMHLTEQRGETREGSLREMGGQSGDNKLRFFTGTRVRQPKPYLWGFADLDALNVQTANRTAASEHPTVHGEANNSLRREQRKMQNKSAKCALYAFYKNRGNRGNKSADLNLNPSFWLLFNSFFREYEK